MQEKNLTKDSEKNLVISMYDAVIGGTLVRDIPFRVIFVKNTTERDAQENVTAGTFAATYGMANIWQKDGDGNWQTVKEEEEET